MLGWGGQGGCVLRIEVFGKIHKKKKSGGGGSKKKKIDRAGI